MIGRTINELNVGDVAEFSKTISESDVYLFAGVTGDMNPAHINESYAQKTFFKTRIVHGMLSAGFISAVLGNQLPGPGSIYVSQDLNFLAPMRIGDTITARVEVVEKNTEKNRVKLRTTCANQDGVMVAEGEAVISPPKPPKPHKPHKEH